MNHTISTSSVPAASKHDAYNSAERYGLSTPPATSTSQLSGLTMRLQRSLRQFPDFPSKGILFEDIMPIFADPHLHEDLIRALELHVEEHHGRGQRPDVIVGLEARGFLFGPSLALRLGAGFVPVRKQGKLPGPTETASYEKEYGPDYFQMQVDGIKPGQKVLIVDDIIATGGSAAAAGSLVRKLGGDLLGYVFILELDFLQGRQKLDASASTLLSSQ
ncbi:adenine phosphoribosyltransferase [Lambiella insularis]|nr:adenine phosphoribosyltransferase [Lambiella insularis]